MDLVCWATASAMILASVASLDSWSLASLEVAAFSSLDWLPITRSRKVSKMAFYSVLYFRTSGFEALVLRL